MRELGDELLKLELGGVVVDGGGEGGGGAGDVAVLLAELADAVERRMQELVRGAEEMACTAERGVVGGEGVESAAKLGVRGEDAGWEMVGLKERGG